MKKTVIKFFDKVILALLGISGMFYSCAMYGAPVDEFELYGIVTDRTNEPIQNIRVLKHNRDTLYTDSEGKFFYRSWEEGRYLTLRFDDIDGEENGGEFISREINIEFTGEDIVKKGKGNKTGNKFVRTEDIRLYRIDEEIPVAYGPPVAPFEP